MPTEAPTDPGRREWTGVALLAIPTMLLSLDISVLFLALPHLSASLKASSTQQLWITDIYGFMIASFLITMGNLGDRIGRRRLLVIGAAVFGLASIVAAYSTSVPMLIGARAVLGIAGATVMPSTLALISSMFRDPKKMGAAIAVWSTAFMAGIALGPVLGGVLLDNFWWGSVFLMGVPVMLITVIGAPLVLPEFRNPNPGKLDLPSVVLSLAAIIPFIYGLKKIARDGWQTGAIVAIVLGLVFGLLFARRQNRLESPLMDLRLFRNAAFSAALVIGLVLGLLQSGTGLFVTEHLQLVLGYSPLKAGLWLALPSVALIMGINATPALAQRIRPAHILSVGLLISLVGQLLLTQISTGLALIIIAMIVVNVGASPVGMLIVNLVMGSAPPEKAGTAASLQSTGGELGVAMGIALMGSLGTIVYRHSLTVPSGVPAHAASAAKESITGAATTAPKLSPPLGTELLHDARDAFTTSLHTVAGVSAVLFLLLACLAFATLRHVPPTGKPGAPGPESVSEEASEAVEAG